jgi:hypothetical protein
MLERGDAQHRSVASESLRRLASERGERQKGSPSKRRLDHGLGLFAEYAADRVHNGSSNSNSLGSSHQNLDLELGEFGEARRLAPGNKVRPSPKRADTRARRVDENPIVARRHIAGANRPIDGEACAGVKP